jgi:hypothetical protein
VTFLLDVLANGPVAKTVILERAGQRGFTEDQLRRARAKAGVVTFKETGKKDAAGSGPKRSMRPPTGSRTPREDRRDQGGRVGAEPPGQARRKP